MARDLIIAAQLYKGDVISDESAFPELTGKTVADTESHRYTFDVTFTDGTQTELNPEQLIFVLKDDPTEDDDDDPT